jgi:hypothetical protein
VATTSPARINDDLYASAKLAGDALSRSASQQVVHWARIGREIEASGSISHKEIAEVLTGSRSYDSLSPKEQAVIRAEWSARMDAIRAALDLAQQFAAAGRTWVELDDDGNVIERGASTAAREATKVAVKATKATGSTKSTKSTKASGKRVETKPSVAAQRSPTRRGARVRATG